MLGQCRIVGDEGSVARKARAVVVAAQDHPFDELLARPDRRWPSDSRSRPTLAPAHSGDGALDGSDIDVGGGDDGVCRNAAIGSGCPRRRTVRREQRQASPRPHCSRAAASAQRPPRPAERAPEGPAPRRPAGWAVAAWRHPGLAILAPGLSAGRLGRPVWQGTGLSSWPGASARFWSARVLVDVRSWRSRSFSCRVAGPS